MIANEHDIAHINSLYEGRTAYQGELHDHAATGGTSDGKRPLMHWRGAMEALGLDFAAILDHKQVRHMYLPEWEDGLFIGGTEPGTGITDSKAEKPSLHYNMIFAGPEPLEQLLSEFEEFAFEGGAEGHFVYPKFTRARFCELIGRVKELGGFFVLPHPKQIMISDDPLDYYFCDGIGIEVTYVSLESRHTKANYPLWLDLLAAGKKVWCCAGGDEHKCASDKALTTVYAEERSNASYISHFRVGDFVCGPVGIRMCVGDTLMGGSCELDGKRLVVAVDDFHKSVLNPEHRYRLDIITDAGVIESHEFDCTEPLYVALDTKDCAFYRTEIYDINRDLRLALGNPIWNAVTPAAE